MTDLHLRAQSGSKLPSAFRRGLAKLTSRPGGRSRPPEPTPVFPVPFIVGAGRSGTTLLRLMLDAHPDLAIPPETHFITTVAKRCGAAAEPRACFVQTLTSHRLWPDYCVDADALRRSVDRLDPFTLADALRAFYALYAGRFGKPRWGDKTPGYLAHMALLQRVLPEVRFVHLIRDGRDVALSLRETWFAPGSIEKAADWWVWSIIRARTEAKEVGFYLEVRYEDLILETESTLRRICAFVDLEWAPAMLRYHTSAENRLAELGDVAAPPGGRVVPGADRRRILSRTSSPPQSDRVARWRRELALAERERYEAVAGALLRELGYEVG